MAINQLQNHIKTAALFLLALFFFLAGLNHFLNTDFYVAIMPPYFPAPLALVYISGVLEMLGGCLVLVKPLRGFAGVFLILLTLAIFPANIYMAWQPEKFAQMASAGFLYARLPMQLLILAWIYWVSISGVSTWKKIPWQK